jgi:hypothetical protein
MPCAPCQAAARRRADAAAGRPVTASAVRPSGGYEVVEPDGHVSRYADLIAARKRQREVGGRVRSA